MTILEAGIIAGALAGIAIGASLGHHGSWGGVGGAATGVVAGAVAGWAFAAILLVLLSIVGVLWRLARRCPADPPTESELRAMTPPAVAGTFISALVGLAVLAWTDWRAAVGSVMVSAALTEVVAVARGERGKAG
jgi:hypothetical protein